MATLETVSPGQLAQSAHFNKLVNAFVNVLGITDDAQANLGRLVMPYGAADPTPVNGQMWIHSGQGQNGLIKVRKGGLSIPVRGMRQRVESAVIDENNGSVGTFSDYSTTASITTQGGRLKIYLAVNRLYGAAAQRASIYLHRTNASATDGYQSGQLRAVVGSANLESQEFSGPIFWRYDASSGVGGPIYVTPSPWAYKPAAGTYTVKLQAFVDYSGTLAHGFSIYGHSIIVEEWDD